MNKLALVRRLAQEAGIAGVINTVAPGEMIQAEHRRASDWIDAAYAQILGIKPWRFLWEQPSLTLASGATTITDQGLPASRYLRETGRSGSRELTYVGWPHWDKSAAFTGDGDPWLWTVRPDNEIVFNSAPAANMAFTVERYRLPDVMVDDTDEPLMPAQYRLAIVYKALVLYCNFEEAGVTRATATRELGWLVSDLAREQLPELEWGAPLC